MAVRGRKPKPAHLKLVEGNPGKRSLSVDGPAAEGRPIKVPKLKGRASKLWAEVVERCWWLAEADSYKLGMWCHLEAEFEQDPLRMIASRISQLRGLGSELGMDPASRVRLGTTDGKRKPKTKAESYF